MLKEAVTGNSRENYAIDFAKVILSIEWENSSASAFFRDDDKATIVVYNETKQNFVTFKDVAHRADRQAVQLPANFAGSAVHTWMGYLNAEGDAVSTSSYARDFIIT
ncbi:hypothetical protein ABIE26_004219 [Pedobacter africanus]|uniref:Uncharacterized protein n=1 Tax=Pedobacter africanus TaxID=151894 RepID=A0ACC6L1Y1_9SPHI|nr:DUF6266 family protein [Pedobacter africanus]MDR6785509.1 hypothetical protein [Pedobacter africanus]